MAKILIIGGTRFMGYFATAFALERGHTVTLFNRGLSNPDAFPAAETLRGDRDTDVDLLRGRRWDAVIDTSGYVPRIVRKSTELLKDVVERYVFVSSISVYTDITAPGGDESLPVRTLTDPTVEEITGETYGGLKVLCEQVVENTLPGRALIVRPGLIVGPRDPTDRFDYWVRRVAQGGEVLVPGTPDYPVQGIDARDLGEWIVRMVEGQGTGTYNAVGPSQKMITLLDTTKQVSGSDARYTWVDEKFLLEHNVSPWENLPLWAKEEGKAYSLVSAARAVAAGLTFRPLEETVRGSLDWQNAHPELVKARSGPITPEREQSLLREWHEHQAQTA